MPKEVHQIVSQIRTKQDEEILNLIRETVAQLNKLGDRLEMYLREGVPEHHGEAPISEDKSIDI